MNEHTTKFIAAAGLAVGALVYHKLCDIHAEIIHFEKANNVWSLKTEKRVQKQLRKEERQKEKDRES